MEEGQIIANWAQHCEDGVKVVISAENYDFAVEKRLLIPFIAKHNSKGQSNKIGLLNKNGEVILEPLYDTILDECYFPNDLIRVGTLFPYGYSRSNGNVSSFVRYKYHVVNAKGEFITNKKYDTIIISSDKSIITVQDRSKGYAVYDIAGNEIVPFGKYSWIDGFDHGLARVKMGQITNGMKNTDNRWGIINKKGEEVLPLVYNNIWNFFGKNRFSTKAIKDGTQTDVLLHDLNPDLPRHGKYRILHDEPETYGRHYGEFAGSYAQDVMGYSDDVINDAFEGDPDAYWNID